MAEKYIVQGYEFSSKEEALEGKKELAAVRVLSEKVHAGSLEDALKIYEKLLEQQMFHTRIGLDYMQSLKTYLADNDVIRDTTVNGLSRKVDQLSAQLESEKKSSAKKLARLKELLYSSLIFNVILIAAIIVMIFIASTSDNVNILNYEQQLQDRYAGWEQELQSKEAALRELEHSYAAQENK